MEEKQPPEPQDKMSGLALTSLNAFSPNLAEIRQTLRALQETGRDPHQAYRRLTSMRPSDWPALPSFDELMTA